jgi:hypothetical protein
MQKYAHMPHSKRVYNKLNCRLFYSLTFKLHFIQQNEPNHTFAPKPRYQKTNKPTTTIILKENSFETKLTSSYISNDGNMMNSTIKLLRILGSPLIFREYQKPLQEKEIPILYVHAIKNRIPLLYLDNLKKQKKLFNLEPVYREGYLRWLKILDAMARLSDFLNSLDIEHAIFKSIKPYPDASVDIDILIFDPREYQEAVKMLPKAGWNILGYGPQSITFFDSIAKVGIDLYREIAASCIVYVDKRKLRKCVIQRMLPNGKYVHTLELEADLTTIIAHSVIKEQVYTLAEYYTFLNYLKIMRIKEVENFVNLMKIHKMMAAVKPFISVTIALHREAFCCVPEKLAFLSNMVGVESLEQSRLAQNLFQTPHKYHLLTLFKSLKNKLEEEKTRKSVATQISNMMRPQFTKTFVEGLISHVMRETY